MSKTHFESERRFRPRNKPYKRGNKKRYDGIPAIKKNAGPVILDAPVYDTFLDEYLDDETVEDTP